ncbi:MAG: phage major capsid protein [Clostridiales bacterium]|nr:phage major capsid protein [Clostridiales bacterium]
MITITNADAALKDYYLDAVNAQLSGEVSPFFNAIEKTGENVFGKDVKLAIAKGGMAGVVAGAEDGELPAPRSNRYFGVTLPLKNIYGTIEISDKAMRASENSAGAFVNLLNAEMEGLVAGAKANFARMLYGDGNGLLCTVVSKKSTKVLAVNNAKSYFKGLKVKVGTGENVIAGVNTESGELSFENVISDSFSGGEKICIAGAEGNEIIGLSGIFDGATLYGYNKSDESYFQPYIKHISGSSLTESDIVDVIDAIEESADGKVNMILCSHRVRKQIAALMSPSRRIVNTAEIAAGYSSIVINDVPVYADKFCPDDRIYFVNTADFVLNQLCDWAWLEDEGGRILKQVAGKAAYSATLVKYAELVCKKPCGQGAIVLDKAN